ncbi:MAG: gas vesicle protein [Deltaproteobacteria bacterium]|nr:gas vesicle protein [Deltaproteobacteria bacterium]
MPSKQAMQHALASSSLADILERVLDKGVVIAGDIKVKLVDIELLTIQIRLVICSVDKAVEMGMDWWKTDPAWSQGRINGNSDLQNLGERLSELEKRLERTRAGAE